MSLRPAGFPVGFSTRAELPSREWGGAERVARPTGQPRSAGRSTRPGHPRRLGFGVPLPSSPRLGPGRRPPDRIFALPDLIALHLECAATMPPQPCAGPRSGAIRGPGRDLVERNSRSDAPRPTPPTRGRSCRWVATRPTGCSSRERSTGRGTQLQPNRPLTRSWRSGRGARNGNLEGGR